METPDLILPRADEKVNEWAAKKRQAARVSRIMQKTRIPAYERRGDLMSECGNKLEFEYVNGRYKLASAWLCRDRLCPICAWRLAIKRTAEMLKMCKALHEIAPNTRALHIVLTVRSVHGEDLRPELQRINAAFGRLRRRALWREFILGYARSIEVTYNPDRDTYHPHIHCIAIVKDTYRRQITMGDWVDLWRSCARLEYPPIVWAKYAYANPARMDLEEYEYSQVTASAAIVEAMKYAVKPTDLMQAVNAGGIMELGDALSGFRLVSFGGLLKKVRQDLGFTSDDEDPQLPECELDPAEALDQYRVCYQWAAATSSYVRVTS